MIVTSIKPLRESAVRVQILAGTAAGGFPSPAADYYESPLSLDELLNVKAPHIWIVEVEGESMTGVGIYPGSRLVVDRSIEPRPGRIVLAYVDNQPIVKRLAKVGDRLVLVSENPAYPPVVREDFADIDVFGVVTWCINALCVH